MYIESQAQFQAYNEDVLEIEDELPFEFSNEQEEFEDDEEFDDEKEFDEGTTFIISFTIKQLTDKSQLHELAIKNRLVMELFLKNLWHLYYLSS